MDPKAGSKRTISEIEVEPDAWERFRRAIRIVVKGGLRHREIEPKRRDKSAIIALFAILAAPLPVHAAAVWISCVPTEKGGLGVDGKLAYRPLDVQEQREQTQVFMIDGQSVYFYAPERKMISPARGTVAPGMIELRDVGIYSVVIDRLTGKFSSSTGAEMLAGGSIAGVCTTLPPQPIAQTKF